MNNLTELVFILDKSGSMCGMEKDVIGGFKENKAKARLFPPFCFPTEPRCCTTESISTKSDR